MADVEALTVSVSSSEDWVIAARIKRIVTDLGKEMELAYQLGLDVNVSVHTGPFVIGTARQQNVNVTVARPL